MANLNLSTGTGIAIIGLAGQFPGAPDVGTFWHNVRSGIESITWFADDELASSPLTPHRLRTHPDFVPAGGVLAGVDHFDHDLFGLTPREARWMDPQQRVFLQAAWAALEDAGYDPARTTDRVSVYAGAGTSGHLLALLGQDYGDVAAQYEALVAGSVENLATRVSYLLRLRGESVTVHTACSTGLAAVHMACQSLLSGQSAIALAGAVRIAVPQSTGYVYQDGMILSRDGHCRAFDHRASGTVAGNGVGVVVLKPLADALANRDNVHAVISGSAMNNDGHRGVGYTAPSVAGQAEVVAEALAFAGVGGADIDYVEAHGTGTPLGDPIEIASLTRAFRRTTDRVADCPIGSIKTNIGHLDTAAGIAGLIKVVLMLHHGEIPPSLHLERPNPAIDFDTSPFVVNTELRAWPRPAGRPRRAGVSSFGIGGTNVHAVLAEAPTSGHPARRPPHQREWHLITLAAQTPAALSRMVADLAGDAEQAGGTDLADIAYTRAVGRAELAYRRVQVAQTARELATALRRSPADVPEVTPPPRVVFLFPGQGSAHRGMAGDLYDIEPSFRSALDECLDAVEPVLGRGLLPELREGSGPIDDPELAHSALFAVEYALAQLWQSWGVQPAALLGHSFGEYAAACVAGVLALPDAARLVVCRGRLAARLPEGRMLAVGLGEDQVDEWLSGELSLAAINGGDRCVVSGPVDAVLDLQQRLVAAKQATALLPVRQAFHSPVVEPVLAELAELAAGCAHAEPRLRLLSSLTGDWWSSAHTGPDYWARQMREPVHFAAALERLVAEATPAGAPLVLVEVGPDQALTALVRDQRRSHATAVASLRSQRSTTHDHRVLLTSVGVLWRAGTPIDWSAFFRDKRGRRIPLPTYPFEPSLIEPLTTGPLPAAAHGPQPDHQPEAALADSALRPAPSDTAPSDTAPSDTAPSDDVERKVFEVWRERLGRDRFGVHDNFLELGGNSLVAAQVLTRLRDVFGAPIPLSALFEAPTVAGIAERIRALTGTATVSPADGGVSGRPSKRTAATALPAIRPIPRGEPGSASPVPLSVVQRRTLALEAADPGNPALAMPVAVAIDGDLDVTVLRQAIATVVERHETLRTTFQRDADGAWTARVTPGLPIEVEPDDVSGGEPAAQQIARDEPTRSFDLSVSPLRIRLLRLAPDHGVNRHILLVTVHHVVSDTLSMVIVAREIADCYRAWHGDEPVRLAPLAVQYADFAAWQHEQLAGGALAWQQQYWRDRMAGLSSRPLPLPTDRPRARETGVRGKHLDLTLPADLARRVVHLSQRLGVTQFVTLLSAYAALLGRVTGVDDLVIGTPVGNRDRPELEPLVGYVAHALPLRIDLSEDPRFVALVGQVQQTLLAAYAHADVPFEALAGRPGTARLFDALFVLHANLPHEQQLPGAIWRMWPVRDTPAMFGATLATLTLMLAESPDGFRGNLGYAEELFDATTASRLSDQFRSLLATAVRRPETRVSGLGLEERAEPPSPATVDDAGDRVFHLGGTGLPPWISPERRHQRGNADQSVLLRQR